LQAFSNAIRRTFSAALTVCSHGPTALAELLVLATSTGAFVIDVVTVRHCIWDSVWLYAVVCLLFVYVWLM